MFENELTEHRTYVLAFNDLREAFRALRKLRKRKVTVHTVVMVVSTNHWNKVKDLMNTEDIITSNPGVILILNRSLIQNYPHALYRP